MSTAALSVVAARRAVLSSVVDRMVRRLIPALALCFALAACAPAASSPGPSESPTPEVPGVPSEAPTAEPSENWPLMRVDWERPFRIDLPNGWVLRDCEGEAPLVCVADGDRHVGAIELGSYPVSSEVGDDVVVYLLAHAQEFIDVMRDDRAIGCSDLTFEPIDPEPFEVGGTDGVRAGFRMRTSAGTIAEDHVLYWAVDEGRQFVVTAAAYGEDGCMERLGEFVPDDLATVLPAIDRMVQQTPLHQS